MASPVQTQSQTPQTAPQGVENETDPTLEKVLKGYRNSKKYAEGGFWPTWEDSWKLYNGIRVNIGYDGFTDTFIPETYTEVQGIKAHLINGNLEVEFLPTHPDQIGDVSLKQDLFNYAWYRDLMDQKLDQTITEYLVTGNCYIWSYPDANGMPCQTVVSAKDCFFDPMIKNYQDLNEWGYGGYRWITTIEALKEENVANPNYDDSQPESDTNSQTQPRFKNLNQVGQFNSEDGDETAKEEREEMLGDSVLADKEGQVECIRYFDSLDKKMITVANRSVTIEDVDTPFQRKKKTVQSVDDQGNPVSFEMPEVKPFIPVAPFRNLIDPNLWYARGDVEIIGPSQERLNDTQAQKTDNLTFQQNRMWALDPNFAQKLDEIQSVPGAVFTIPPGALEQIPTQPIGPDADNEIARIKSEMQAASGSNEAISGTLQTSGRQSAYQINQNLVALGARFQVKIKNLQGEAMRILVDNMDKIMQIFIDKEIPIRTMGANGSQFAMYNPGLYLGDWDMQVKLGAVADSVKETERQQMMQYYLLASKQPFVNPQALFVTSMPQIFPDVNKRAAASLIMPQQPTPPPPTAAAALASTIQFGVDLYPDEQAEVLTELAIQPSPLRTDQTGINPSQPEPSKITANLQALNPANGATPGGNPAFEQAGVQTAGSPPVGAPTSGVANMPKVPA